MGPHKTVIWITAMTYELLPTGECSGKSVKTDKFIADVVGNNKDDCLDKTEKILKEVKECLKK